MQDIFPYRVYAYTLDMNLVLCILLFDSFPSLRVFLSFLWLVIELVQGLLLRQVFLDEAAILGHLMLERATPASHHTVHFEK